MMLLEFVLFLAAIWTGVNLVALLPSYTEHFGKYIWLVAIVEILTIFIGRLSIFIESTFLGLVLTFIIVCVGTLGIMTAMFCICATLEEEDAYSSKFFCLYRWIKPSHIKEQISSYLELPEEFPDGVYDVSNSEKSFNELVELFLNKKP